MRDRTLALALTCALAAGACSDGSEPVPLASVTDLPSPSPTPTPSATAAGVDGEWAVPDPITPEYVERVYEHLESILAEQIEAMLVLKDQDRLDVITPEMMGALAAVYSEEVFSDFVSSWETLIDLGMPIDFQRPVGPRRLVDAELVHAGPECVVARGRYDESAHWTSDDAPDSVVQALMASKPNAVNPTGWRIGWNVIDEPWELNEGDPCAE